jgi:Bacterial pre-peptidase C-terminal domain
MRLGTGAYQLAISDGKKAVAVEQGDLTTSLGQGSMMGQLATGDTALNDGSLVDYYTIALKVGQSLDVSVMSADFDAYIGLIKPSGEVLEANRSEDGTSARLDITADEAGVWYVIVTSAKPGQTGNYLVSIR